MLDSSSLAFRASCRQELDFYAQRPPVGVVDVGHSSAWHATMTPNVANLSSVALAVFKVEFENSRLPEFSASAETLYCLLRIQLEIHFRYCLACADEPE